MEKSEGDIFFKISNDFKFQATPGVISPEVGVVDLELSLNPNKIYIYEFNLVQSLKPHDIVKINSYRMELSHFKVMIMSETGSTGHDA